MNDTLKRIIEKHAAPPAGDFLSAQRTPASITSPSIKDYQTSDLLPPPCAKCGGHGALADGSCPFATDGEIIGELAALVVEEFSTRDAQALVRLLCTEGARIGLELHEALRAPEKE